MDATLRQSHNTRRGNVLVLLAILMPILIGVVGLVIDSGMMMDQYRDLQHATDAAATTAATELRLSHGSNSATAAAIDAVQVAHEMADAGVTVHIPPASGPFAGDANYVEVLAESTYSTRCLPILGGLVDRRLQTRSVAGVRDATAQAAIVVLDPNPAPIALASASTLISNINLAGLVNDLPLGPVGSLLSSLGLGSLLDTLKANIVNVLDGVTSGALGQLTIPGLPALTAGFEVEGLGRLYVDGSILVNTEWGGKDEHGKPAGRNAPLPYAVACMPVLPTTRVFVRDLRVAGGVDSKTNYQAYANGGDHPLQANRLPVPDPLEDLPTPTTSPAASQGHKIIIKLLSLGPITGSLTALLQGLLQPLLGPIVLDPAALTPGVYESITIISLGEVQFNPGVYVIRNRSNITQMSLCALGGWIKANNVMFYITDSAAYNATTGAPDASDNHQTEPPNLIGNIVPSVLLAPLLPGSSITGISDVTSPYHGLVLYQRRVDRRPIIVSGLQLLGGGGTSGTIYAKWAHVTFLSGLGTYDLRFVCGAMRLLTVGDAVIAPTKKFAAARDVYLVE